MDNIQIQQGLVELFELFPTPPKKDLSVFLGDIQNEVKFNAIKKSQKFSFDFHFERPLQSGKYAWKEDDELLNYCRKNKRHETIVSRSSLLSTNVSFNFDDVQINQVDTLVLQMGVSCHSKLCSLALPDQEKMIVIPQYLCVSIMRGAIVEYTVGTQSVTGVHVKFDFGDGFCATTTQQGTVITGGLQSQSSWLWNGSSLENLPKMNGRYQRHWASSLGNNIVVISGIHSKDCELHNLNKDEWEPFGSLQVQRSNATSIYTNNKIYVSGGIDSDGKLLTSIEFNNGLEWCMVEGFRLQRGLRNAGAIPLHDEFIIFGGSSRAEISCDSQPLAWRVSTSTQTVQVFGKVHISGSFSPYQPTTRDSLAAIFSEEGKLYQFDYTKLAFTVPDFMEIP